LNMNSIYGKKIGMTRIFTPAGDSIGVTAIEIEPATVLRVKTGKTDGYSSVVVSFGKVRPTLLSKPVKGQFEKNGQELKRNMRELRLAEGETFEKGATIGVDIFKPGEKVHISGTSRGLGFQGAMRRHHFKGGPKSHGQSDRMRAPGSVGASSYPSRTFLGQRMAGHMGCTGVTVKNVQVVGIEPEQNLLLVNGPVPGHRNSIVFVRKAR
jgi:large subunit ribosomal protein L3